MFNSQRCQKPPNRETATTPNTRRPKIWAGPCNPATRLSASFYVRIRLVLRRRICRDTARAAALRLSTLKYITGQNPQSSRGVTPGRTGKSLMEIFGGSFLGSRWLVVVRLHCLPALSSILAVAARVFNQNIQFKITHNPKSQVTLTIVVNHNLEKKAVC